MRLTLNVLRCPDAATPESRQSSGGDIAIGRGLECDWVLQDPDRVLSKRHCVLEFRGGYWQVRDTSTNGTFLNGAAEPVGREMVAPVSDGDRLRFGTYEIEIRVTADAAASVSAPMSGTALPGSSPPGHAAPWGEAAIGGSSGPGRPAADPFADPFAPSPGGGLGDGALPGGAGGLPADWDPMADLAPMPDHTPAASDAFTPPRPIALAPASAIPPGWDPFGDAPPGGAAGAPPAAPATTAPAGGLPADWDPLADLDSPAAIDPPRPVVAPPSARAPAILPVTAEPPLAQGEQGLPAAAPPPAMPAPAPVPPEALGDPFAEEGVPSRSIPLPGEAGLPGLAPDVPGVAQAAREIPGARLPEPWAADAAPPEPPSARQPAAAAPALHPGPTAAAPLPVQAVPAAGGASPDAAAALAALLRGAAIAPGTLSAAARDNPLAVIEQAGAALRAAVGGLRALLIARADVKREFRIEQTMLRAVGNNPLKFAATDDMAVGALISGQGTRAVAETVNDLTAHEVATLAATQAAARALLNRLAPDLVEEADGGGGGLFGGREKRLWEAYRKLHTRTTEQFEDDFDSAFGKEFARAYEQAVASKAGPGDDGGRER